MQTVNEQWISTTIFLQNLSTATWTYSYCILVANFMALYLTVVTVEVTVASVTIVAAEFEDQLTLEMKKTMH